ncbi:unnamed protein product [Parnassius mnemosyne]|uniref:Ionotropic receptor IR21a n=1 Tax=Parnassius mnemosyne TaxID=213953 RepID=A0AAV1M1Z9_9NEOP
MILLNFSYIISLYYIFHLVYGLQQIEYYFSRSFQNIKQLKSDRKLYSKNIFHKNYLTDCKSYDNWLNVRNNNISLQGLKSTNNKTSRKRAIDSVFHGYPKTKEEIWHGNFLDKGKIFDPTFSLIKLIHNITLTYLNDCTPIILYDRQKDSYVVQNLLKDFPASYIHGYIDDNDQLREPKLLQFNRDCIHFVVFLSDVQKIAKVLGKKTENKVIVVTGSSQWAVQEFLAGPTSRMFVNLLVIGKSFKEEDSNEAPYILYTHKLYIDGLGASKSVVLNSWSQGKFSRELNLFPPKMSEGYAGHRFIVSAANQPPYTFRRVMTDSDGGNPKVVWDGIEIRLLNLLAERNNFSLAIVEPRELHLGSGDAVAKEVIKGRADIAAAGMYITSESIREIDMTFPHSQDCAIFITLMSTALPRYRAILGPFHWHVWVALTFTYLIGIFPLAFSDKHTLQHLLHDSGEIENMFWYVFGTFTNCFTFVGKNSWSKTTKITTRILIGWYWLFTIIITSCYTGSIIAFVTLPIFPETVDTVSQLLSGFYRVGTLDRGGWERWFLNSSDPKTNKLLKKLEFVPNVETGIRNITKAFFWPYAFLGSRAELEYIIQANFTETKSKRAVLHISNECFVPFGVALGFPRNSVYYEKLSADVRRMWQSGIIDKILNEVRWEIQRTTNGRPPVVKETHKVTSAEEKGLTLEDTQGMFLLLGAGFLIAAGALISEWMGGCSRRCRFRRKKVVHSGTNLINNLKYDAKIINNESDLSDSRLAFTSAGSRESLEGQVINVSEESIVIHNEYNIFEPGSKSVSADFDREIKEIFERDHQRRNITLNKETITADRKQQMTNLTGAFGGFANTHEL